MRIFSIFCAWVVMVFVTQAPDATAMSFKLHSNNNKNLLAILATGPVESGDTANLERFIRGHPRKKSIAIYLASPGGSLYEGMKMGRFFKRFRIKSVVEGGKSCASACALAFLGGHDNNGWPWRSSSNNSKLGFHAFSSDKNLNTNDTQEIVSDVLSYGKDVQAPIELMIVNFATPSESIYWLSEEEMCSLGIKIWSNRSDRFIC